MSLAVEDIEAIEQLIDRRFQQQSAMPYTGPREVVFSGQIVERIVRVEEELKHQRELLITMQQQMEKRFEQVDKRFEYIQQQMEKRFEQVDRRFEQMDKHFEYIQQQME